MSYEEDIDFGVQQMLDADLQFPQNVEHKKIVPMSNADRVRAMSDEELVGILGMVANGNIFDLFCDNPKRTVECDARCFNCIREWLKQPAEEESG